MAQVAVQINGKTFRMACDEGQESHLMGLAQELDRTIDNLRGSFGEIGDQRLTVMAGVVMADQLSEARARVRVLEADLKTLRAQAAEADGSGDGGTREADPDAMAELGQAIERTAETVERITHKLRGVPSA